MRAAFAVGSAEGWPFEVWALYTSQREAQRHADGAAYEFGVFALPVYERDDDVPRWLGPPWGHGLRIRDRISDELMLTAEALMADEIEVVPAGPVVAILDVNPPEPQEVRVLFTDAPSAVRYLQNAAAWLVGFRPEQTLVYERYEDCPPRLRHTLPGAPISQRVHRRSHSNG